MPSVPVLIAVAVAVVIVVVVGMVARRRGDRTAAPDLPPPPGGSERPSKVRVLPSDENAREARSKALSEEMESLRREAEYAERRGLDRRARRLRAMIEDRRRQRGAPEVDRR